MSKTVKKTNNSEIKFATAIHPKKACNLLKSVSKSKRITEELETVEKPKNFGIESVTMEHKKTTTKLSKLIKLSKIITHQLIRIRNYTESK